MNWEKVIKELTLASDNLRKQAFEKGQQKSEAGYEARKAAALILLYLAQSLKQGLD